MRGNLLKAGIACALAVATITGCTEGRVSSRLLFLSKAPPVTDPFAGVTRKIIVNLSASGAPAIQSVTPQLGQPPAVYPIDAGTFPKYELVLISGGGRVLHADPFVVPRHPLANGQADVGEHVLPDPVLFSRTLPYFEQAKLLELRDAGGNRIGDPIELNPSETIDPPVEFETVLGSEVVGSNVPWKKIEKRSDIPTEGSLRIAFVGDGFAAANLQELRDLASSVILKLVQSEPFHSRAHQIRFQLVPNISMSLGCAALQLTDETVLSCNQQAVQNRVDASGAPWTKIIALRRAIGAPQVPDSKWSVDHLDGLQAHGESNLSSGHLLQIIGMLSGLYPESRFYSAMGAGMGVSRNCLMGGSLPPEWLDDVGALDLTSGECAHTGWKRPSPASLMALTTSGHWNSVSQKLLQTRLDYFAGAYANSVNPVILGLQPSAAAPLAAPQPLSLDVSDDHGVARVQVFVNGAFVQTAYERFDAIPWPATALDPGTYAFRLVAIDAAGNRAEISRSYVLSAGNVNVTEVNSTTANGSYGVSRSVSIDLKFVRAVTVDTSAGSPKVLLETGDNDRRATYVSGSGSNLLKFNYIVQAGDRSPRLDVVGTGALELAGAKIRDAVTGENVDSLLPAPGSAGSLSVTKNLVIDTTAPVLAFTAPDAGSFWQNTVLISGTCEAGLFVQLGGAGHQAPANAACPAGMFSQSVTFSAGDGAKLIEISQEDSAGNIGRATRSFEKRTSAPTVTDIRLADGSPYTRVLGVPLTTLFNGEAPYQMVVSFIPGCTGTSWEPFAATKPLTLPSSNALNTVYAKYRDRASNETPCLSKSITHDDIAPSGANLQINGGAAGTNTLGVTLTLAATGATQMAISNGASCATATTWEAYVTTKSWSLAQAEAVNSVSVHYRDEAGNVTPCVTRSIQHTTAAPGNPQISINGGDVYTQILPVSLTLSATGASQMYVTQVAGCGSGGAWETYATSRSWTLPLANARNRVHVKYRNIALNESACVTAEIEHDNLAPTGASLLINGGASVTASRSVTLSVGGVGAAWMALNEGTSCTSSNWIPFATSAPFTLSAGDGAKTVSLKLKDVAGNESGCVNDGIQLDSNAIGITINSDATHTRVTAVTLNLSAVGYDEMYVTNTAGCGSGGAWEGFATAKAWTLAQTNATATVYVRYRKGTDLSICRSDTIIHDSLPPSGIGLSINGGELKTHLMNVTLGLSATGASQMYVTNVSGCASGGSWQSFAASRAWTLSQSNATNWVYSKFRDEAGNESTCTGDSIVHDDRVPISPSIYIDGNALYATSTAVTLSLSAELATEMYVTQVAGCTSGGVWQPVAPTRVWTLATPNVTNTVYVKFRNAAGSTACVSDSIVHDSLAPSGTVLINAGAARTNQTGVQLTFTQAGAATRMYVTNVAGCASGGTWEAFSTGPKAWTLSGINGTISVYARFQDAAGNLSACVTDAIQHSNQPPTGVDLLINGGATHTNSATVVLRPQATEATEMYITNAAGCSSGGNWVAYSPSNRSWILAQSNATARVYYKYRNAFMNETACLMKSIIHDSIAPTMTITLQNHVSGVVNRVPVVFKLQISEETPFDRAVVQVVGATEYGSSKTSGTNREYEFELRRLSSATPYLRVNAGAFTDFAGNPLAVTVTTSAQFVPTIPSPTWWQFFQIPDSSSSNYHLDYTGLLLRWDTPDSHAYQGFEVSGSALGTTYTNHAVGANQFSFGKNWNHSGDRTISLRVRAIGPGGVRSGWSTTLTHEGFSRYGEDSGDGRSGNGELLRCLGTEIIAGVRGRSGGALDRIDGIYCRSNTTASISSERYVPVTSSSGGGGGGGDPFDMKCLNGYAVDRLVGRSGQAIDRFGIRCKSLTTGAFEPIKSAGGGGGSAREMGCPSTLYLNEIQWRHAHKGWGSMGSRRLVYRIGIVCD